MSKIRVFQVFLILYLMSSCNCTEEFMSCPDCASPAFMFSIIDSSGNKSGGFTIKLIDKSNNMTIINDTSYAYNTHDTSYSIFIRSSNYNIEITRSGYDTVRLNNISVTENRCGIANTREFTIKPEPFGLMKSRVAKFQIVKDTTRMGCGG
jgi:hypothetical protein